MTNDYFVQPLRKQKQQRRKIFATFLLLLICLFIFKGLLSWFIDTKKSEAKYRKLYNEQQTEIKALKNEVEQLKNQNTDLNTKLEVKVESAKTHNLSEQAKVVLRNSICQSFGKDNCQAILKIQSCENGRMDPSRINVNTNRSIDVGLFQINSIHRTQVEALFGEPFELAMMDPFKNIKYAQGLFKQQGFGPWDSSGGCHKLAVK